MGTKKDVASTRSAQDISCELLSIAKEMSEATQDRETAQQRVNELTSRIMQLQGRHLAIIASLTGDHVDGADQPYDAVDGVNTDDGVSPTARPTHPGKPLVARVVECLGSAARPMTIEEIANAIGETATRVNYCIRDLKAKREYVDLPSRGHFALNAKGRRHYQDLSAADAAAEKEAPM